MSFRTISKAFFLACACSIATLSSARSDFAAIYHVEGASSQTDVVAGKAAAKRLQDVLTQSASHGTAVQIFLSGIFLPDAPITLSSGNANTVLSGEGAQGALLLPQQSMFATIRIDRARGVTIKNLSIRGSARNGIYAKDSRQATMRGLTIVNTASTGWSQGAIHLTGDAEGSLIAKNTVEHSAYSGIIVDTAKESDVSNIRITDNTVTDSCSKVNDCGAIYINDRGRRSTDIVIAGNRITDFGGTKVNARAIYLDDWASHVTVTDNTIAGPGNYAFHIHGGHDNTIKDNTIKLQGIAAVLRYGRATDGTMADMTDNVMTDNTFIAGSKNPLSQFPSEYHSNVGKIDFAGNRVCKATSCKAVQ